MISSLKSVAAHYVPGSPSGVKSLELKVWLHILCAWQPFRRYQSLASVAANYVPGSPSGVIRFWQAWLHIMCLAAFQALSDLAWQAWLHIMCLAALQALSELGKCAGCTLCAWQPFRRDQSLASVAAHYVPGSPSGDIRAWQAWLRILCLAALQA